jgi:hypothetical protein
MEPNSVVLYLHIVGVLGFFVALGVEWIGLRQVRIALIFEQVHAWMSIFKGMRRLGFVSMGTAVVTGIYLMVTDTGLVPYVYISILALILVMLLSIVITGPRMAALGHAMAIGKGTLTSTFYSLANHPLLIVSIQIRIAIALGIVFLKITKPELAASLLAMGVAIVLGLASTVAFSRRQQTQKGSSTNPSHP